MGDTMTDGSTTTTSEVQLPCCFDKIKVNKTTIALAEEGTKVLLCCTKCFGAHDLLDLVGYWTRKNPEPLPRPEVIVDLKKFRRYDYPWYFF